MALDPSPELLLVDEHAPPDADHALLEAVLLSVEDEPAEPAVGRPSVWRSQNCRTVTKFSATLFIIVSFRLMRLVDARALGQFGAAVRGC
jgi:hypothetical protein